MCAADNAAHTVQGRLRSSTADAKTTAVQRHSVLQERQESGCSIYCYGIRLSEERHDTMV